MKKKLIYLEDALEEVNDYITLTNSALDSMDVMLGDREKFEEQRDILTGIIEDLKALPTQPEIIWCKDCRFAIWYTMYDGVKGCSCSRHGSVGHTETDFCSRAERKEDG